MKNWLIPVILLTVVLVSCSPDVTKQISKTFPALKPEDKVRVLPDEEKIPNNAEKIGSIMVDGRTMSSSCSYEEIMTLIKKEAKNCGGNLIAITYHKKPGGFNSCHKIYADIYHVDFNKISNSSDSTGNEDKLVDNEKRLAEPKGNPAEAGSKKMAKPKGEPSISDKSNTETGNTQANSSIGNDDSKTWDEIMGNLEDEPKFRISASGGWGYLIGLTSDYLTQAQKDFINGTRSGYLINTTAHYYFNNTYGLGLQYSFFHCGNETSDLELQTLKGYYRGKVKDGTTLNYFGISLINNRIFSGRKINVVADGSVGYFTYTEIMDLDNSYIKSTSGNFAMNVGIGIETSISKQIRIGIEGRYAIAIVSKIKFEMDGQTENYTVPDDQPQGLNHIGILAGIRWTP